MTGKIHTLVFLGFTAVAAASMAGCVGNRNNGPTTSCLDMQYATVAWNIVKDANNVQLSCEQANATEVLLYFGSSTPYSFPCNAYQGTTDSGLAVGNYTTSMQLLAPNGAVLSDTAIPAGASSFPIYRCAPDDIPTVTFGVQ